MENTTLYGTETKTLAVKRENNCLDFLQTVKSKDNLRYPIDRTNIEVSLP